MRKNQKNTVTYECLHCHAQSTHVLFWAGICGCLVCDEHTVSQYVSNHGLKPGRYYSGTGLEIYNLHTSKLGRFLLLKAISTGHQPQYYALPVLKEYGVTLQDVGESECITKIFELGSGKANAAYSAVSGWCGRWFQTWNKPKRGSSIWATKQKQKNAEKK